MRSWVLVACILLLVLSLAGCVLPGEVREGGSFPVVATAAGDSGEGTGSDAPPRVEGLHVETLNHNTMLVSWDTEHAPHGVANYEVYVNTSAAPEATPENLTAPSSWRGQPHYADNLQPETEYHFRVRAVDFDGNPGALSGSVSNTTLPALFIRPQDFFDLHDGNGRSDSYTLSLHRAPDLNVTVDLDWDDSILNVTRPGDDTPLRRVVFDSSQWSAQIQVEGVRDTKPLFAKIHHSVNTTAMDRDMAFDAALTQRFWVSVAPVLPDPVHNLQAKPLNSTAVQLRWDAQNDPVRAGYRLQTIPIVPLPPQPPQPPQPPTPLEEPYEESNGSGDSQPVPPPEPEPFPWPGWLGAPMTRVLDDPDATDIAIDGLLPDTEYEFLVFAINEDGFQSNVTRVMEATMQAPQLLLPPDLRVTEGERVTYNATLSLPPDDRVFVWDVHADSPNVVVSPTSLVFDGSTDKIVVTVDAHHDHVDRGDETILLTHEYNVGASTDVGPRFTQPVLEIVRVDKDDAGFGASPGHVALGPGDEATVQIHLFTRPLNGTVVLQAASEGDGRFTVDSVSLQFDAGDWNVPQNLTVRAKDDAGEGHAGNVTLRVAADGTSSPEYVGFPAAHLPVSIEPPPTPEKGDIRLRLQFVPEDPMVGDPLELHVAIDNLGNGTLRDFQVVYYINDQPVHKESMEELEPGGTLDLVQKTTAFPGDHEIRVAIPGWIEKTIRLSATPDGEGSLGDSPFRDFNIGESIPGPGVLAFPLLTLLLVLRGARRRGRTARCGDHNRP